MEINTNPERVTLEKAINNAFPLLHAKFFIKSIPHYTSKISQAGFCAAGYVFGSTRRNKSG